MRPGKIASLVLTLVIVAGLGWVAWTYVGTNVVAQHRAAEAIVGATAQWADDRGGDARNDPVRMGETIAVLRIERFGDDFEVPVVEGIDDSALTSGVGHFPDTQRPGEVGNFAVAGHRITNGQPFSAFPDLRQGDLVEVETRTHVYTYELREDGTDTVVDFSEIWVLDPVPGKPDAKPRKALITLTTCSEIFHTDDRSVAVGELVDTRRAG
ncbi:UNVERIFIED_CONTAM: hypothetical protein LK11_16625 [Mumia flava]